MPEGTIGAVLAFCWGLAAASGGLVGVILGLITHLGHRAIAADSEYTTDDRVKQAFFIVEPNLKQLTRIGSLLEAGDLQPVVDAVLPLTRASEAYTGEVRQRRGCGKVVVAVAAQEGA